MNPSWEGFGDRIQRLNPLFALGRGMEVGALKPYLQNILFHVILELFYRELNDQSERKKQDILLMVEETIRHMKLEATSVQIERITSGLLYQGKEELAQAFESPAFNEQKQTWDTQTFRYVTMDEMYTDLHRGGDITYKLTDIAQEMVFMSREMAEEFSITIEQLYSIQLIKNGNFSKAKRNADHLLTRVRKLMNEEIRFQQEMLNNPKILVQENQRLREEKKETIEGQFEEEKKHFKTIFSLLEKAHIQEMNPEVKRDLRMLQDMIEDVRQQHDRFAKVVIENISIEMRLKVENPSLFWKKSMYSFRETVVENWLMKEGLKSASAIEELLAPLFSPKQEFMLPLDWIWGEQEISETYMDELMEEDEEEEIEITRPITDWEAIADAWEPVFDHLLQFGEFRLSQLRDEAYDNQTQWFQESETFELWMMFDRKPLYIDVLEENQTFNDERETLIHKLYCRDPRFHRLQQIEIYSEYEPNDPPFQWRGVKMTPFKLVLKERRGVL